MPTFGVFTYSSVPIQEKYSFRSTLGNGAFGSVRLAIHRDTGLTRAIKIIKKADLSDEEKENLKNEVQTLQKLDHPNIIKLYEAFEDFKYIYLVTEVCEGGELFDVIIARGGLSEKEAAVVIYQVLSGISYCNDNHIVHRDLKPENILLATKGPEGLNNIKIVDFGAAQVYSPEKAMTKKLGTPYYVAPEVLNRKYDAKCDVWSTGVLLFILLSGSPPFFGASDQEIMSKVKIGKFSMTGKEWGNISTAAKELVCKMLEYDPSKRLSAREVLRHDWLQQNGRNQTISASSSTGHWAGSYRDEVMRSYLTNIQKFANTQKLQHATLAFIATQLSSKEDRNELNKIFMELDTDGNGTLSLDELEKGFSHAFGYTMASEDIKTFFDHVDVDRSGAIDYTEFLVAAMDRRRLLSEAKLEAAFKTFDMDHSGKISTAELERVFLRGDVSTANAWREIIQSVDKNNDGELDFDEFKAMMKTVTE